MIPSVRRKYRRGFSWGGPLALSLLAIVSVHGQTPPSAPENPVFQNPANPTPGFVLLRNGRVLIGAAQPVGSRFRIMRGRGDEIWLPATQVEKTAATIDELYQYQLDSAQRRGFAAWVEAADWLLDQVDTLAFTDDDRVRLAQTARRHCELASSYRSNHPSVTRLRKRLDQLERREALRSAPPSETTLPAAPPVQLATYAAADRTTPPGRPSQNPAAVLPNPERLKLFAVKIQPTLINRCRNCHATDSPVSSERANAWLLDIPAGGRAMGREVSIANLKRTDAWIDRQADVQALAQYATTAHGGSRAEPISQRHRDARRWIEYFCQTHRRVSDLGPASSGAGRSSGDGRSDETDTVASQHRLGSDHEMRIAREVPELASIRVPSPPGSSVGPASFDEPSDAIPPGQGTDSVPRPHRSPRRLPSIANPHDPAIFHALPVPSRSPSVPDHANDPIGAPKIP